MAETNTSDYGSTLNDVLADASDSTKAKVANAEQEMLLQYVLGLDLRDVSLNNATPNASGIAAKVVQSIVSRIDQNRTRIDQNVLQNVLDTNITNALRSIVPHANASRNNTDQIGLSRIRAIAEAIYASLSKNLLDELLRYSMPVALQVGTTLNRHKLFLGGTFIDRDGNLIFGPFINPPPDADNIVIDTRARFWVENGPFADADALAEALKGKKFTYCGIETSRTSQLASHEISEDLANVIAQSKLSVIGLSNKYQTRLERVTVGGNERQCSIDLNGLVSAERQSSTTLPNIRYFGECNRDELVTLFRETGTLQRFVHGIEGLPLSTVATFHGAYTGELPEFFADFIFERVRGAGFNPLDQLSVEERSVFEIQRELREQHQYHTRLREGSDNSAGAALAASILMRYKDIESVLGGTDRQKVEEERLSALHDLKLLNLLEKFESVSFSPTHNYQDWLNALSGGANSVSVARGTLGAPPAPPFAITIDLPTGPVRHMVRGVSPTELARADDWVNRQEQEIRTNVRQYEDLINKARPIFDELRRRVTGTPPVPAAATVQLYNAFSAAGVPNPVWFSTGLNLGGLCQEVISTLSLKPKAQLEEDVKKADVNLKDIADGKSTGLSGMEAQHAVVAKYFENYHGCTSEEAQKAANYMLARAKVDNEVTEMAEGISDDLYEDDRTRMDVTSDYFKNLWHTGFTTNEHAQNVISGIARAAGIPVQGNTTRWARANYRQLVTAYFSLKKLYNDGDVAKHLKLPKSRIVQEQMREITKQLMQKHAVQLLKEFGTANGINDEKINAALKDPTKKELVALTEQFLNGEAPANYQKRINDAIKHAESRVEWGERTLRWGLKSPVVGTAKLVGKGAKKGFGGSKWVAGKGAHGLKTVAYDAPKAVLSLPTKGVKGVWNNKGSIATIAGLSLLGGPIAGVGAWYLHKQFSGGSSSSLAA